MNKVYKVIWSNAKNCYVVVSELAKSRVKAVNLCKTLVAVSILTAVVSDSGILARAYAEEKEAISVKEEIIDDSERYISEEDIIDEEKINKTMSSKAAGDKKPGDTVKYDNIITGEVHEGHKSGEFGDIAIGENSSVNRVMQDHTGNGEWGEDASAAGVAVGANASVMGGGGTAVGQNTKTVGTHSLAVGSNAQTFGVDSISIGASASVGSEHSSTTGGISVGSHASVTELNGIAIGTNSNTDGVSAISIGAASNAAGSNAIAIGTGSKVEADKPDPYDGETYVTEGIAIGSKAHTSGFHGVALGASAKSFGRFSVALGEESIAEGNFSTSLGGYSKASGKQSTALGYKSEVSGEYSAALGGYQIIVDGSQSVAVGGWGTKVSGNYSAALGSCSIASGDYSTALGHNSTVSGQQSTALGSGSKASSDYSAALGGYKIVVDGSQSIAVGGCSTAVSGNYSTALGSFSNVTGEKATALGYNSKASHENSVALGSNSETAAAVGTGYFTLEQTGGQTITFGKFAGSNPLATVSVGKEGQYRTITNVAAGRISIDSTDAINGSQLFAIADGLQDQINEINTKIDNSGDDHYHTVNGKDKEDKTDISNNTDITNNNQDNDVIEKADDINTPASGNSGGTNTDPVGDKPELGGEYTGGDGNLLIKHDTDSNGNKYYDISLNQDLNINSMNVKNEIKVGDNITINSDEIKVGDRVTINDNSVNVGDVTINEDNIDMGGNKIINVAEGTEGTDAVNVNQLKKLEQNVNNKINRLDGKIDKVGAGAAALAALHPLDFDPDDKLNFSAGVGNYHGSTAAAIGAFYQPNDDTLFSIGGTVGNGDEMVNVGVSFRFGQHSNQSRSKKAMAKEIIELRTEIAELKAMMYSLTGQGFDPYKSKIFPDTPENHWAYDYVAVVAGNGILEGYPNGRFDGSRAMTRYEMAAVIYRLMTKGIQVDERMLKEFAPELARVKVDTLTHHEDGTPSIQRVRIIEGRG